MSSAAIPVHVALIADPSTVDPNYANEVAGALNEQVQADFAPVWHVRATSAPTHRRRLRHMERAGARRHQRAGRAGLPLRRNNVPYAVVQYDESWPITASHEVLEMLADPFGNRMHAARLPLGVEVDYEHFGLPHSSSRVHYLVEVADPCEAGAYEVGGVMLSDFLLPSWYRTNPLLASAYSHTGTCSDPREVAPGGYVSFSTPDGSWWQVFSSRSGRLSYQLAGQVLAPGVLQPARVHRPPRAPRASWLAAELMSDNKITINVNPAPVPNSLLVATEALALLRIAEHRRGEHTYGSMRRDCPLCQRH
jgi:hypothetical protein